MTVRQPCTHADWPRLTSDQRRAVTRVWDDCVVPALEQAVADRRARDAALREAQDARAGLRLLQARADLTEASARIAAYLRAHWQEGAEHPAALVERVFGAEARSHECKPAAQAAEAGQTSIFDLGEAA